LATACAYLALASYRLWPLPVCMNDHVPIDPDDPYLLMWILTWDTHGLGKPPSVSSTRTSSISGGQRMKFVTRYLLPRTANEAARDRSLARGSGSPTRRCLSSFSSTLRAWICWTSRSTSHLARRSNMVVG